VPELVSCPQHELPPVLRAEQLRLHRQAWPDGGEEPHDPALRPLTMLLVENENALATLDVLSKDLDHRGHRYRAAGLSAVVTDRAVRGHGHGGRLVAAAREAMAEAAFDLGLFTCDPPLAGFYQRAGWQPLPGTVLVGGTRANPLPSDALGKVTFGALFTEHARRHAVDFAGARIELYPGEIDRLW